MIMLFLRGLLGSPMGGAGLAAVALPLMLLAAVVGLRGEVKQVARQQCESEHRAADLSAALASALTDRDALRAELEKRSAEALASVQRELLLVAEADELRDRINKADPRAVEEVFGADDEWLKRKRGKR